MRKEIDMTTYPKRNQFLWFRNYSLPCYGFDVDIDVTSLVLCLKERSESFFPYFLYAVMKGINAVDEMRMRLVEGKPYLYDKIHPTFTVMTEAGVYQNCGFLMPDTFREFYTIAKKTVDEVKEMPVSDELDRFPICKTPNVVFATCIPILNFTAMSHPLPLNDPDSMSIPRVCWGKYHQEKDGSYHVMLNITVSHVFVDGFPLSRCFEKIQEEVNLVRTW